MTFRRKFVLTVLVIVGVLVLTALVVLPRIADINRYRPEVISRIEEASGRSAAIGRLNLAIIPELAVRADDIAIGNPPGFPAGRFLEVRRVYARLDLGALLHHHVVVRSMRFQDLKLNLLADSAGRWNTESPERLQMQVRPAAWQTGSSSTMVINKVTIEGGRVTGANVSASGEAGPPSVEANGVAAELEDVDTEALGLHLMEGFNRNARGNDIQHARLWRSVLRNAALTSADAQDLSGPPTEATIPQGAVSAHGTLAADSARFGAITTTSIRSGLEIHRDGVLVKNIVLQLFGGRVNADLLWDPSLRPPRYTSHLALSGVNVEQALLNFPSARGKLTGLLDGKLVLSGWTPGDTGTSTGDPLANLQGAGAVTIRNGSLPAIRLNRDLTLLMKNVVRTASGSPDPSTFRSMSADFEIARGQIQSRQITILGNGINLTVSGSLGLAGAGKLDYRGTGEITARHSVGSLVAGLLGSKMDAGGKIAFPFTLTGTLAAPRFEAPKSPFLH